MKKIKCLFCEKESTGGGMGNDRFCDKHAFEFQDDVSEFMIEEARKKHFIDENEAYKYIKMEKLKKQNEKEEKENR